MDLTPKIAGAEFVRRVCYFLQGDMLMIDPEVTP